jgi:hypothetical protein
LHLSSLTKKKKKKTETQTRAPLLLLHCASLNAAAPHLLRAAVPHNSVRKPTELLSIRVSHLIAPPPPTTFSDRVLFIATVLL